MSLKLIIVYNNIFLPKPTPALKTKQFFMTILMKTDPNNEQNHPSKHIFQS